MQKGVSSQSPPSVGYCCLAVQSQTKVSTVLTRWHYCNSANKI